uniref:PEP/pyruvate-binding domain-containing protein n=1 Tax=Variovorax boronicumulans TaxID=436515 RepID=UPI000ABF4334
LPGSKAAKPDLRETRLLPLASLRARHSVHCGSKAANLGAVLAARIPSTTVPDGFCIPFAHYDRFMRSNGLAERLARMQQQPGFAGDPQVRQKALAQLRDEIVQWPVEPATAAAWRAAWQAQLGGGGVFVRSSSNSEDLPGFSGAGLYTTVPNVKTGDALELAVKKVWASVFNPEAWEARSAAGFGAESVLMGVFVQTAIDSTNAGVMITRDPFDAGHPHVTYISAKRGIGIRVVEGKRVAEQVMYSSWSKAIQVLSRSAEETALQLDKDGGVKEVPVEVGRHVLTDELVVRLANVGAAVKRTFNAVDQDIEWATVGDKIVLLQARPYVERRR